MHGFEMCAIVICWKKGVPLVAPVFYSGVDFDIFLYNGVSCEGHRFKPDVILTPNKNDEDSIGPFFELGVDLWF